MADSTPSNPLLSTARASDTSPHIQLHPLVLLTISDYITRHTLRQQEGPIVGAIIGQQNGREITMEVAFECKLAGKDGEVLLHESWFKSRLESFKEVYKSPALDLVGWFTLGSSSGPQSHHLPIHQQLQAGYNESAVLLLFHADAVIQGSATGGKLPLTLYKSVLTSDGAGSMDIDSAGQGKTMKFQELSYSVETGEAEMISVDFVARGGGNATAVDQTKRQAQSQGQSAADAKGKGKAKEGDAQVNGTAAGDMTYLSPEDDELISSLTAKLNATKMLHQRIRLLEAYLSSLPPSYLTDASLPLTHHQTSTDNTSPQATQLDHQILRSVLALLSRLPLLVPATGISPSPAMSHLSSPETTFARESLEQKSDVSLVSLLSSMTRSVQEAKELGRKSAAVEGVRAGAGRRGGGGGGGGGIPGMSGGMEIGHAGVSMGGDVLMGGAEDGSGFGSGSGGVGMVRDG